MTNRKPYKDFVICSTPHFLADYNKWHMSLSFEKLIDTHIVDIPIICPINDCNLFDTEEEATEVAFMIGQHVIDGKVRAVPVDDS
jgi:hypothetical protein